MTILFFPLPSLPLSLHCDFYFSLSQSGCSYTPPPPPLPPVSQFGCSFISLYLSRWLFSLLYHSVSQNLYYYTLSLSRSLSYTCYLSLSLFICCFTNITDISQLTKNPIKVWYINEIDTYLKTPHNLTRQRLWVSSYQGNSSAPLPFPLPLYAAPGLSWWVHINSRPLLTDKQPYKQAGVFRLGTGWQAPPPPSPCSSPLPSLFSC